MPIFSCEATNSSGSIVTESIEAESPDMAKQILISKGYTPIRIIKEKSRFFPSLSVPFWLGVGRISAPDLVLFTKQFGTMIRAGVNIRLLLQILENQVENPRLSRIIARMFKDVHEGHRLFEAFSRHPKVFSPLYCSMIQAGETSGQLGEVMARLSYILEHEYKVKSDVKAALQYPIIVLLFLVVAFFVLLTYVIPKFAVIFRNANIALPLPTQICLVMYEWVFLYWHFLLLGAAGLAAFIYFYIGVELGRYYRDVFLMKVPLIGQLIRKASMSRFASIFSILHFSGVPILNTMRILSNTIGNAAIAKEFDKIRQRIEEGGGISGPLKKARYFTPMVVNMVAIGEASGNLGEMLREISNHYDTEVEYATKRLSEGIGPFLTICLAVIVGFFALAIFLPMWDIAKTVR